MSYFFAGVNILFGNYFAAIEKITYSYVISIGRGIVLISILLIVMSAAFGAEGIWWAALINEVVIFALGAFGLLRIKKISVPKATKPLLST